jgi:hypothetical protein
MSKVKVTIKTTHTAMFNAGDIPANLIKALLEANDGTFDGNWSLGDIRAGNEKYVTDSVEVEEVK